MLDPYTGRELGHYKMDDWSNWRPNIMNIVYGVHTTLATRSGDGWQFMGYVALVWQLTLWLRSGSRCLAEVVLSGRGGSRHGESSGAQVFRASTSICIVQADSGFGHSCALRLVERDVYHATGVSTGNAEGLWDTTI